jgi:PAS domain-containing protein
MKTVNILMEKTQELKDWIVKATDCMGVAVTIIDETGVLLYYNDRAAKVLDRKAEYIGNEIYDFHKKSASNDRIRSMLEDFRNGRTNPFHYVAKPYGKRIFVTVVPILVDGRFTGCVQSVITEEDVKSV